MWHEDKYTCKVLKFFFTSKTFSLCPDAFPIAQEKAGNRMWANSKLLCGCLLSIFSDCRCALNLRPLFWILSYCFWGPRPPHCKTLSRSVFIPPIYFLQTCSSDLRGSFPLHRVLHLQQSSASFYMATPVSPAPKRSPSIRPGRLAALFYALWRCSSWRTHTDISLLCHVSMITIASSILLMR